MSRDARAYKGLQTGRRLPRKRRKLLLTISSDLPAFSPFTYTHGRVPPVHIVREAYKYKSDSPFSETELRMQPRGLFVKRIFSGEHAGQRVLRVELIPNKNMWNIFTEQTSEPHTSFLHIIAKRPRVYVYRLLGIALHAFCFPFRLRVKFFATNCLRARDLFLPPTTFLHFYVSRPIVLFQAYVRLSLFFPWFVSGTIFW